MGNLTCTAKKRGSSLHMNLGTSTINDFGLYPETPQNNLETKNLDTVGSLSPNKKNFETPQPGQVLFHREGFEPPESFLLSVKVNNHLIAGGTLKEFLSQVEIQSRSFQLEFFLKVFDKLRGEEGHLENYRKHENFAAEVLKRLTQLLSVDVGKLATLQAETLFNKLLPEFCLDRILLIYHILLSHKINSNNNVDIWWTNKKYDRKLDSVVHFIIELSGKIRYEFDKKTNKHEEKPGVPIRQESFVRGSSFPKDLAFESEFLKNVERLHSKEGLGGSFTNSPKLLSITDSNDKLLKEDFNPDLEESDVSPEYKRKEIKFPDLEHIYFPDENFPSTETQEDEPQAFTIEQYSEEKRVQIPCGNKGFYRIGIENDS